MKVVVVSGIWPPDVGGPASHAPDVARFLQGRGWGVQVVTTARSAPAPERFPVHWVTRRLPRGVRHAAGAAIVARHARGTDVVYTTGTFGRSAAGATLARRPYVVKLTADPAFERAQRTGVVPGDLDAFQRGAGGVAGWALRSARDLELRGAGHVFTPSAFLRELAIGWGVPPERVSVLPNPAPAMPELAPRDELRARLGVDGPTLAFAGRLTAQKSLHVALEALAEVDGATLLVAGEGDELSTLRARARELGLDGRVRFLGAQPRDRVLELFRAADAAILSSAWENFPHTVVEALAAGTPVIATDVGGVREAVDDGVNGLLVPPGDAAAFAAALRRYLGDETLRRRLQERAQPSVERFSAAALLGELESVLRRVASG
jgi:glycosyltransferase involved in cell wall biosynthesis